VTLVEVINWLRQTKVTLRKNPTYFDLGDEDLVDIVITENNSRVKAMLNHRFKKPKDVK
jgi:hypothetical protein